MRTVLQLKQRHSWFVLLFTCLANTLDFSVIPTIALYQFSTSEVCPYVCVCLFEEREREETGWGVGGGLLVSRGITCRVERNG